MTKRTTRAAGTAPGAKGKRPRGRPPKLTYALTEALCAALGTGAPVTVCASAHGIHRSTYYEWLDTGLDDIEEERRTVYADFAERIPKSVARGELSYWAVIAEASRAASAKDKDGRPVNSAKTVAAKVAAAKVAINALRTRWGKRYKSYSETRRAELAADEPLSPTPDALPGDYDPSLLSPEEQRLHLALLRKMQPPREED